MTTYMVCDEDGYALTDGLQEHEAKQVAQSIADRRLESVWLSESDSDGMGEEFEPNKNDPVVKARMTLAEWDADEASEDEIAELFAAIYGHKPDADDDAVDMIFAAKDVLEKDEAERVNKVI